ncbi:YdcF family protein [Geobacter pelophilus]|uniref:YdcF family protein n=1 Tax=Geoanaerobacter pelophilus TaxID=60036 RepID=A0AAW4L0F5_9BACT|nr:YdcF family protein [Geoanaerobacter pelophilus]
MLIMRGVFFLLLILLIVAAVLFVDFTYKTFSLKGRDVNTDAIVVLTGGLGRVDEGVRLYKAGKAGWLLLVGVDPSVRKVDLYQDRPGERSSERVILEKSSRNTLENALYSRELILGNKITSIKLITSRYHMKRATLFFRAVLPRDIAIYPHPVDSRNLLPDWWGHSGSIRLLFSEFYKYTMFRLFFLIAPSELRPSPITG